MSSDPVGAPRASLLTGLAALLASGGTLVCCALPALLVALGAGAVLSSLVSAVPGLVWISEHKEWMFAAAGAMLVAAGVAQMKARRAPCPTDPALRSACENTRQASGIVFGISVALFAVGGWFAYVQPALG
jgi:predicted phage tail protein